MKTFFILIISLLMTNIVSAQRSVSDFLVKSQSTISKSSPDDYYRKYVVNAPVPSGVDIVSSESFIVYTLNASNFKLIEVPVGGANVNLMYVLINLNNNSVDVFFQTASPWPL